MKLRRIIKSCGLVTAIVGLAVLSFLPVKAADQVAQPATWIQISPVSQRIDLSCGQKHDGSFKVSNIGSEIFDFEVYASSYGVQDMSYDPVFDKETNYTQLSKWISFDQESYQGLAPGANIDATYHIDVPADCPGGGQYAVLFAQAAPKSETGGSMALQTVSRVGQLVFVNMGGETRKTAELVSFKQNWWTDGKISSDTVVKNTGNVDFSASQSFLVSNLFGEELYSSTDNKSILPETSRELRQVWEETPLMGIFNVTNQTTYLGENPVNETRLVLVAPIWLVAAFSTVLCLIIVLIVVIIIRKIRK